MKRYYNEAETPLRFHKILHYAVIPYICIMNVLTLFDYAMYSGSFTLGMYLELGLIIANVVLLATVFLGFYSFSNYAWYALMGYLVLRLSAELLVAVLSVGTFLENIIYYIIEFSLMLLVFLYYFKRKPLFFPNKYSPPIPPQKDAAAAPESTGCFCTACGKQLKADYVFCPNCGTSK